MITIEYPCDGRCVNGKITYIKGGEEKTCNSCNGVGKKLITIGCIVEREINLGDHGETRLSVLDVDPYVTVREFLQGMFNDRDFSVRDIDAITFSKATQFTRYVKPEIVTGPQEVPF